MNLKPIDVVCAVIYRKGKILVAQRSEVMRMPLKWEFPGGKMELGESEEECLHRELKEELNISVKVRRRLEASVYDYGGFAIRLVPFVVDYDGGEVRLAEHKELKAFLKEELDGLDWAEADRPVLEKFLSIAEC